MEFNLQSVFELLTKMPGSLAFYLILLIALAVSGMSIFNGTRAGHFCRPNRVYLGLSILLLAVFLPAVSGFNPNFSASKNSPLYPILERTALSWMTIWIAWLWLAPRPSKFLDWLSPILSLLIPLLIFVFPSNNLPFNGSPPDILWHFAMIFIALLSTFTLVRRNTPAIGYGIGMLFLILVGVTVSLVTMPSTGEISGAARLGILCAFPLLPVLALRQELMETVSTPVAAFEEVMAKTQSPMQIQPLPEQINNWLDAAAGSDSISQQVDVARILCQTLDANACFFLQMSEKPWVLRLTSGYNYNNKTVMQPQEILSSGIPKTAHCVTNNTPKVLQKTQETRTETESFSAWLEIPDIQSLAILPIHDANIQWGAAVLVRLSSSAAFQESDLQPYTQIMAALTRIFRNSETASQEKLDIRRLSAEIFKLQEENQKLRDDLESARLSAVQVWPEPDLNQLLTLQQASQSEIDRVREENRLLLQALAEERDGLQSSLVDADTESIEKELANAKDDLTQLQNLLNESHDQVEEMEKRPTVSTTSMQRLRKYNSLTTQIRNPVAAITGYVDLLLSEEENQQVLPDKSATLQNLKSALAHLRQIMSDLSQINILESGVIDLDPENMDLAAAIDKAVTKATPALMEKEISFKLSLPEKLPPMQSYREALQKVIVYLLHNAGKVTPPHGRVELRVDIDRENTEPYLLLEVTDSGGGINPGDIKRVFLPEDQAGQVHVSGIGRGGNGLSSAKTLIEAHGGRIWVDSNPGMGTTFSVLLPIDQQTSSWMKAS